MDEIARNNLWVSFTNDKLSGVIAITTDQPPEYLGENFHVNEWHNIIYIFIKHFTLEVGWDLSEICVVPHRLAVSPKFHRAGIATMLMQQAEVIARERSLKFVRVDTCSKNVLAKSLIEKLDYVFVGELVNGFPLARDSTFLCYEKRIG